MNTLELVRHTSPTINSAGAAFYFDPATLARGKEVGLDGFRLYFLGRGGVLGNVEPAVVVSAFGYFNPTVVENTWNSAREVMEPRAAGTLYMECAGALGASKLGGIDGLVGFNEAAEAVMAATDLSALPLFAGVAAEARSDDPAARAFQNVTALRELRGSVHLVALASQGLSAEMAHRIKRPDDVEMFGWSTGVEPSDADRAKWDAAEALTDELLVAPYSVLSPAQADAFAATVDAIGAALS